MKRATCKPTAGSTTTDAPITLKPTSSFPNRQAIDECGGTCFPNGVPNDTTISNCIITFKGPNIGVWYALAVQVRSDRIICL